LKWKKKGKKRVFVDMNATAKDLLYASCGDGYLTQNTSRHHDPLLKLYYDMPVMINYNIDVAKYVANGAYCRFEGVKLKASVTIHDLETIQIDGYFVRCAAVTQIEHIILRNEDAPKDANGNSRLVLLKPQ
jgi:hypothetical protein